MSRASKQLNILRRTEEAKIRTDFGKTGGDLAISLKKSFGGHIIDRGGKIVFLSSNSQLRITIEPYYQ